MNFFAVALAEFDCLGAFSGIHVGYGSADPRGRSLPVDVDSMILPLDYKRARPDTNTRSFLVCMTKSFKLSALLSPRRCSVEESHVAN